MPNTAPKTPAKSNAKPAPKRKPAPKAAAKPAADKPDALALAKRIAGERKTAASIFAQAKTASVSIPVKPISAYGKTYKRDVTAHAIGRKPSPRQAAALAVAAAAAGIKISDGATFPRKFEMRGCIRYRKRGALRRYRIRPLHLQRQSGNNHDCQRGGMRKPSG